MAELGSVAVDKALPHSGFSSSYSTWVGDDTLWQAGILAWLVGEGGGDALPHSGASSAAHST